MGNKTLFIIIGAVIIIAAAGYLYWSGSFGGSDEGSLDDAGDAANAITEGATQGVLPSLSPAENPLQDVPNVNPVDASNPFKDIKTNPFE
jgi:hypothetical protein